MDDADRGLGGAGVVEADVVLDLDEERRQIIPRFHPGMDRCPSAGWAPPHDDIEIARALEADVELGQSTFEGASFVLQLGSSSLELAGQREAVGPQLLDSSKRNSEVDQRDDPAQIGDLGRRVVAIAGRRIDPNRLEQSGLVVVAEALGRNPG